MPLSAADFTTSQAQQQDRAQGAAAAAPSQPDIMQTPPSEQNAQLQRPHPGGLSENFEANRAAINNLPAFLQPLASLGEFTARRLVDPALRTVQNITIPPQNVGQAIQRVSDIGELATAAVAPEAVALGGASEVAARTLGADEDTARWISSAAEMFGGMKQATNVGKRVFKEGRGMIESATERTAATGSLRQAGSTNAMKLGESYQRLIPGTLRRRGNQLGPAIGRIEREFANTGAQIDPNSPLYSRLDRELERISGIGEVAGPAGRQIERLRTQISLHKPVLASELADLKQTLTQPARAVRGVAEPAMSASAAAAYRDTATTTLADMMPRDTARQYQQARTLYAREVGRPRKILSQAYKDSTSPTQLFNQVFSGNDPFTMRTVAEVAQNSPSLKAKLALGYLENMSTATNGWREAGHALDAMKNTRGIVENSGILSTKELDTLEYFLKRRSLPQVVESFQALVGTMSGAVKGSAATGMAYVASGRPSHMLAALVASGSLSPLRRLMLVPKGSAPWKRAGLVIANNLARFANEVSQASGQPQEGEDELRGLMEPALP